MLIKNYSIVLAVDEKNGIGKNGTIPWRLKKEQLFFKEITVSTKSKKKLNAVVMGRKTWESLPSTVQPLPGRINCVLSSEYKNNPENIGENIYGFNSFEECHKYLSKNKKVDKIFIIGGSYLYNLVLESKYLEKIFITRVQGDFKCDVFFSQIPKVFKPMRVSDVIKEGNISYQMFEYEHGKNLLLKVKKPKFILSVIGVVLLLVILGIMSISLRDNPSGKNIIEEKNIINNTLQEDKKVPVSSNIEEKEIEEGEETLTEENMKKNEISPFQSQKETSKEGFFSYPITNISELDLSIRTYVRKKQIEYRIYNFNQRNIEDNVENILDYQVLDNSEVLVHIRFTETRNGQTIGTKDIIYTKK